MYLSPIFSLQIFINYYLVFNFKILLFTIKYVIFGNVKKKE